MSSRSPEKSDSFTKKKQKFEIPPSLRTYLGTDFDALIPGSEMDDLPDDEDEREVEMNNLRVILIECLDEIEKVMKGASIYRAMESKKLKDLHDEILSTCNFGHHWTSCIWCADVSWGYGEHSGGFYTESGEKEIAWEKPGIIILEALVKESSAIDFTQTIDLYFQFGEEESEIYIWNDSAIELVRMGIGSTTGRARADLIRKQEKGVVLDECK